MAATAPTDTRAESDGRSRILLSAAQLFLEHGYAETSLRTIADAVDMRPASIYHHFDSKDALLGEILEIGMDAVMNAFTAAERTVLDAQPAERLTAHVSAHLEALFANHAFTAAHVTVFPFVPDEVRVASVPRRDEYEARWTDLLHDLAPGLDDEGVRVTRLSLLGVMNSTLQWFDPAEGALDDLARTFVDTMWRGLEQRGAR